MGGRGIFILLTAAFFDINTICVEMWLIITIKFISSFFFKATRSCHLFWDRNMSHGVFFWAWNIDLVLHVFKKLELLVGSCKGDISMVPPNLQPTYCLKVHGSPWCLRF